MNMSDKDLKEYILMCENSDELQESYNPKLGDYAVRSCENENYRVGLVAWRYDKNKLWWMTLDGEDGITLSSTDSQKSFLEKLIWLPCQDQLQKIVADYYEKIDVFAINKKFCLNFSELGITELKQVFIDFATWITHPYLDGQDKIKLRPTNCFNNGEKLWLAFVMQTVYNKKWDELKNEWIKMES